jgi:hypothetical protein
MASTGLHSNFQLDDVSSASNRNITPQPIPDIIRSNADIPVPGLTAAFYQQGNEVNYTSSSYAASDYVSINDGTYERTTNRRKVTNVSYISRYQEYSSSVQENDIHRTYKPTFNNREVFLSTFNNHEFDISEQQNDTRCTSRFNKFIEYYYFSNSDDISTMLITPHDNDICFPPNFRCNHATSQFQVIVAQECEKYQTLDDYGKYTEKCQIAVNIKEKCLLDGS